MQEFGVFPGFRRQLAPFLHGESVGGCICGTRLGQSPAPPSWSRDCSAWTERAPLCIAVDWHSLIQRVCSPAHWSRQGRSTCRKNPCMRPLSVSTF